MGFSGFYRVLLGFLRLLFRKYLPSVEGVLRVAAQPALKVDVKVDGAALLGLFDRIGRRGRRRRAAACGRSMGRSSYLFSIVFKTIKLHSNHKKRYGLNLTKKIETPFHKNNFNGQSKRLISRHVFFLHSISTKK